MFACSEHKLFGRDKPLGAIEINAWELVGPLVGTNEVRQSVIFS